MSVVKALPNDKEIRNGLVWPKADDVAFEHIQMYLPVLRWAARKAKQKGVAIQAGGNAGTHPVELAKMFDSVVTFEPESLNFECLKENILPYPNVKAYQAVLGKSDKSVGLHATVGLKDDQECVNTGAFIAAGEGDIPQMRIDDLELDRCDFIQLDVEGWELNALQGAHKTIDKYSPVIMVERFGHGIDPEPFLLHLGYRSVLTGVYDHVYVRKHGTNDLQ